MTVKLWAFHMIIASLISLPGVAFFHMAVKWGDDSWLIWLVVFLSIFWAGMYYDRQIASKT
jgi:hypothetical protein